MQMNVYGSTEKKKICKYYLKRKFVQLQYMMKVCFDELGDLSNVNTWWWWQWWWCWNFSYTCLKSCLIVVFNQIFCHFFYHHIVLLLTFSFYRPWDRGQICIKLILFSTFRKCYRLLGSELSLARCQPLKV